jgi:antitoxin component of MazEF toxin-antitoxin module
MIKTISKLGDSQGLNLDQALMELARLKVGDQVNVEVHAGGTITIAPINSLPPAEKTRALIRGTMKRYAKTMKRLA